MVKKIIVSNETLTAYTKSDKNKPKPTVHFGIKTVLITTALLSLNVGSLLLVSDTASAESKEDVANTSSKVTTYKTTISGKSVTLKNKSLKRGTKYFISPTEVLKKLGATVAYSSKNKILTIKAGSKKTTIKADSHYTYVNGVKYKLSSTMQKINGKTYVPYDIISKATKYKASVSNSTIKIVKKSTTTKSTSNNLYTSDVKALYQGHTYNIKTQAQYDKVIDWVRDYMQTPDVKDLKMGGEYASTGAYSDYYNKGKTFNFFTSHKDPSDITDYELGLSAAEASLSSLKKNGVSYSTAVEVWKLASASIMGMQSVQAKEDHTTDSLYDYIFNHRGDCDGDAQMYQIIYDMHGYETKLHYAPNHTTVQVKLGNHWYNIAGDTFSKAK